MVCRCNHCGEYIEYDSLDLRLSFGVEFGNITEIYIVCPVCGKSNTVGVTNVF